MAYRSCRGIYDKTLRDEFALAALQGLCANESIYPDTPSTFRADVARTAYSLAEAMMQARAHTSSAPTTEGVKPPGIFLPCSECGAETEYIANLHEGSDTGFGREDLYQCPKCKKVETR